MQQGVIGAGNLNLALQNRLNQNTQGLERGNAPFVWGDKVMQIKNNYDFGCSSLDCYLLICS